MKKIAKETLRKYGEEIPDIMSRFSFDHHPVVEDTGLIVTPQGFARPFFHKPTNTVGLLFSKTSNNLRGSYHSNGKNYAKAEQIERCYIITARRCKDDVSVPLAERGDKYRNEKDMRHALDDFCHKLGERNQKHFTGFMADDVFTNGALSYEIVERKRKGLVDRYDVVLHLPTRRKDGSFIPFGQGKTKGLRRHFEKVSKTVATAKSYEHARLRLYEHWGEVSAELWDEKNIFSNKGLDIKAKKLMADFVNVSCDHAFMLVATTLIVSGVTMLIKPALGLLGAIAGTIAHTMGHVAVEKGIEGSFDARRKVKEAKNKLDINAYEFDTDVSDHFKIQNEENIAKLCSHLDTERFDPEEFELLDIHQMNLLRDREQVHDNLRDTSLAGQVLFMHQRGFSSICSMLDNRTEIRLFQNGVVRLMHEKEDGNIVAYSQYRPELCMTERLRLPERYIDQYEGGILRVEYDRCKSNFSEALVAKEKNVSRDEMLREVQGQFLFSTQTIVPWYIRLKSIQSVQGSFVNPKHGASQNIHLNPPKLPDLTAANMKFRSPGITS